MPQLRSAQTIGDWNITAAQLLWLESFSAVGGPLEDFLQQFVLTFVLLCIFHVLQVRGGCLDLECLHCPGYLQFLLYVQALEKAARTRGYLPVAIIPRALARFRLVIDGKLTYDQYKEWLQPYLVAAHLRRDDGTFAWFAYLDEHWRFSKWRSLVSSRFRSLLARFGVDTNNTLEGTWETIKNKWGASSCHTITALFKLLVGLPGDSVSQELSWLSKRRTQFESILRGRQRVGGGYKRDRNLLRLRRLIALIASDPATFVSDVGAVVLPQIPARGSLAADFSWLQCFNALIGHCATRKARYALWAMACDNKECRDHVKSPLCVHGLYAIHRHVVLGREPCVRCFDREMYFCTTCNNGSACTLPLVFFRGCQWNCSFCHYVGR